MTQMPPTLPISEILADIDRQLQESPMEVASTASQNLPPPTLSLSEIFADVDRQLVYYPVAPASRPYETTKMMTNDEAAIASMDLHVRSIIAGNNPRLFVLNTVSEI